MRRYQAGYMILLMAIVILLPSCSAYRTTASSSIVYNEAEHTVSGHQEGDTDDVHSGDGKSMHGNEDVGHYNQDNMHIDYEQNDENHTGSNSQASDGIESGEPDAEDDAIETMTYDRFVKMSISDEVFTRIENKSYKENDVITISDLCYIKVLHYGFDGEIHEGELIVNNAIADDIVDIFKELFEAKYPIEQMILIDAYDADDDMSMKENNTSAFNFRVIQGSSSLSNHAKGMAIDINPLYNPYVKEKDGQTTILPAEAKEYTNRDADCSYFIQKDDACYNAFIKRGFTWGGDWNTVKDYQHFEKNE